MGYSIATPIKSEKAKVEMMEFLNEHYRSPDTFIEDMKDDGLFGPFDNNLSYVHLKCAIGFDYTSWSPGREFANSICRWMALRVG